MFRPRRALKLFYSYAHEDEKLRDKLETALALLRRQKYIESWHDRKITGGKEWAGQIDENLASADVVLLLISPDFMASDYISEVELEAAMNRHARRLSRVVPILLRPTDWETSDIAKLNFLPTDAKPITTWSNEDEAFNNVAKGIRRIVDELQRVKPVGLISVSDDTDGYVEAETKDTLWTVARRRWRVLLVVALVSLAVIAMSYAWSKSNTIATRGESWLDIGDYQSALMDFQLASRWNPLNRSVKNGILVSNVALAHSEAVNFRRGIAELSKSIPDNPHVLVLAGDIAYDENRAGDALGNYQAAYKARPSLSEAYFRAGVILRNRGSIPEAKNAFKQAMEANPAAPAISRYSNNLAFCLAKLGRLEEALELYGKNTNYPLSALEASRLLLERGDFRRARDFVQQAVDWLSDKNIVALPQNQGPWDFETSKDGIRLTKPGDKLCYAQIELAATNFLLSNKDLASDVVKRASCSGVIDDVIEIVNWDLEVVRKSNASAAKNIDSFRIQILEQLN